MLLRLPPELRVEVASHLQPAGLLALGGACRACRAAADHDSLWRELLHRQLQPMLHAFFDGVLPPPEAPGRSWKRHYFDFRGSWKRQAQKRTGRLLVQIGKQRPSGRAPHELISMLDVSELWWPPRPDTYSVYDVTTFVHHHPGADLIITDAAEEADATHLFEINGHSDAALRVLNKLAVPGLEAIPYDHELDALKRRRRARWSHIWRGADLHSLLTIGLASGCVASLVDFLHEHPRFCFVPAVWLAGTTATVCSALWGARKRFLEEGARKKGWLAARLAAIFEIVPVR